MFMSNNAQATATYTAQTGLPSSGATDATAHTLTISLNDTVPNINWSFDGVAQTAINKHNYTDTSINDCIKPRIHVRSTNSNRIESIREMELFIDGCAIK